MIDERRNPIADAQTCHLAKKNTMRGVVLAVDHLAVEYGDRVLEHRRAGRDGLPFTEREALVLRKTGQARKRFGERPAFARQGVQREAAVPEEQVVRAVFAVQADQYGRRAVGHRAGGDHGRAPAAGRTVRGHDMHRARKARHRVAIMLRADIVYLEQVVDPKRSFRALYGNGGVRHKPRESFSGMLRLVKVTP